VTNVDVDVGLVRRLEASAATASLDLIDAIRLLDPSTAAEGREFHGGALTAMGPDRYVNRAIGATIDELSETENAKQWLEVFARGFEAEHGDTRVANDEIGEAGRIAPNAHTFLAFLHDEVVGCGSVQMVDGVAWLGGAATIPKFRQRGVQAALVAHRLRLAADLGGELAATTAAHDRRRSCDHR
jgi:GNAT superfamily N-acetyltransferase